MKALRQRSYLAGLLSLFICSAAVLGQSTNQSFPTPVSSNEINGTIKARDVGDARLTSYYYQFDGDQGDLFINVVARNFTGDIDVFTQNGLRPLTKIVVYSDFGENETGRVIYLRKPEKMILRVQGRTPGDEAASFRIKFAGSFVASTQADPAGEPALPTLTAKTESGIRVNSVGTIVEVIPKATPTPAAAGELATGVVDERSGVEETEKAKAEIVEPTSNEKPVDSPTTEDDKKIGVVVTENVPEETETKAPPATRTARGRRRPPARTPPVTGRKVEGADEVPTVANRRRRAARTTPPKTAPPKEPDPLEKINLVIEFKDGNVVERPMSQVLRFTVDKGVLTVIAKDGAIERHSILDVAKVTIQ